MKRLLLHLAIAVFAFELGVTISESWRSYNLPEPFRVHVPAPVSSLELATIGYGSNSTMYLANGEQITRTCLHLPSSGGANDALRERLQAASDVVEWSDIIDRNGQRIGQTILILENPTVIRLSTRGEMFCETRAASMNEMRWFEIRELELR